MGPTPGNVARLTLLAVAPHQGGVVDADMDHRPRPAPGLAAPCSLGQRHQGVGVVGLEGLTAPVSPGGGEDPSALGFQRGQHLGPVVGAQPGPQTECPLAVAPVAQVARGPHTLVGGQGCRPLGPHRPAPLLQRRQGLGPRHRHQLRLDTGPLASDGDDLAGLGRRELARAQSLGRGRKIVQPTGRLQRLHRRADGRPTGRSHEVGRRAHPPALPGPGRLHPHRGQRLARRPQPLDLAEQLQRRHRARPVEAARLETGHHPPDQGRSLRQLTASSTISHTLMLSNMYSPCQAKTREIPLRTMGTSWSRASCRATRSRSFSTSSTASTQPSAVTAGWLPTPRSASGTS